jgi:hypothetical protein
MSAAAALRARLLGRAPPAAAAAAAPSSEPEVVALPLVTEDGRAAPGAFGRAPAGGPVAPSAAGGDPSKRPARLQRYDAPGEKARFYADDDARSLRDLVAEARHGAAGGGGGGNEYDANLARNVARAARFKGTELNADDEYDHDAGLDMYEKRRGRGAPPEREEGSAPHRILLSSHGRFQWLDVDTGAAELVHEGRGVYYGTFPDDTPGRVWVVSRPHNWREPPAGSTEQLLLIDTASGALVREAQLPSQFTHDAIRHGDKARGALRSRAGAGARAAGTRPALTPR